jgi:hypothetical protein
MRAAPARLAAWCIGRAPPQGNRDRMRSGARNGVGTRPGPTSALAIPSIRHNDKFRVIPPPRNQSSSRLVLAAGLACYGCCEGQWGGTSGGAAAPGHRPVAPTTCPISAVSAIAKPPPMVTRTVARPGWCTAKPRADRSQQRQRGQRGNGDPDTAWRQRDQRQRQRRADRETQRRDDRCLRKRVQRCAGWRMQRRACWPFRSAGRVTVPSRCRHRRNAGVVASTVPAGGWQHEGPLRMLA